MSPSKSKITHGASRLRLVHARDPDDTIHTDLRHSGGNDGGDGMDDLRKRVERAEDNIAAIQVDLAKLTTRSEEFATRADILGLQSELKYDMATLKSELKDDMTTLKSELKNEIGSLRSELSARVTSTGADLKTETSSIRIEIQKELTSIHKELSNQTKWIAATMIGIAGISLAVAKYLFS